MDTIIKNAHIVNVFTGKIESGEVGISNGKIIEISNEIETVDLIKEENSRAINNNEIIKESPRIMDADGKYLIPGLIDSHVHIESSYMIPTTLAPLLISCGTTTIIADPHEITSVLDIKGILYMFEEAKRTKLRIYFTMPYRILKKLMDEGYYRNYSRNIIGLGEVSPYLFPTEEEYIEACNFAKENGFIIEGHLGANYSDRRLDEAACLGVSSCHESISQEEALKKLKRGITVIVREGSAAKNLEDILTNIKSKVKDTRNMLFGTDDLEVLDIFSKGHIDNCLRKAVKVGLDPVEAIQMATINAAKHFKLDDKIGSISPGKVADLVLMNNLIDFKAEMVMIEGKVIYESGKFRHRLRKAQIPYYLLDSIKVEREIKSKDFEIKTKKDCKKALARVIGAIDGQITSEFIKAELEVEDGNVLRDLKNDILKIAVIDRYKPEGKVTVGFINSFCLKEGAIATSIAHDEHNILVVGATDEDMVLAANEIIEMQGGLVVVNDGKVLASVNLPIAGLMTNQGPVELQKDVFNLHKEAEKLGIGLHSPFMTLSFLCLPIPELKIDTKGILDVYKGKYVSPIESCS